MLECCHQVGGKNEVIIFGKSFPNKADVKTMIFSRSDIVELSATDVDKEFAIKSEFFKIEKHKNWILFKFNWKI